MYLIHLFLIRFLTKSCVSFSLSYYTNNLQLNSCLLSLNPDQQKLNHIMCYMKCIFFSQLKNQKILFMFLCNRFFVLYKVLFFCLFFFCSQRIFFRCDVSHFPYISFSISSSVDLNINIFVIGNFINKLN
jgi:hypothetical protein